MLLKAAKKNIIYYMLKKHPIEICARLNALKSCRK
jgi:hypothetical protein